MPVSRQSQLDGSRGRRVPRETMGGKQMFVQRLLLGLLTGYGRGTGQTLPICCGKALGGEAAPSKRQRAKAGTVSPGERDTKGLLSAVVIIVNVPAGPDSTRRQDWLWVYSRILSQDV
ncbi:hypothetical protein J6590_066081 [Homalodisca vitripennis]|nr:hypothetical protein J6590_066081 [Homalodisca vitripennis]